MNDEILRIKEEHAIALKQAALDNYGSKGMDPNQTQPDIKQIIKLGDKFNTISADNTYEALQSNRLDFDEFESPYKEGNK